MPSCYSCSRLRIQCVINIPDTPCVACMQRNLSCRVPLRSNRTQERQQQRERWASLNQAMLQRLTRIRDGLQAIQLVERFQRNSQTLQLQAQSLRNSIQRFTYDQALAAVPRGRIRLGYRAEPRSIEQLLLHSFANLQRRYELLVELVSRDSPAGSPRRSLRIAR